MKTKLLFFASLLLASTQLSAQLPSVSEKLSLTPDHVQERLSNYENSVSAGNLLKNNSYDRPAVIDRYAVDMADIEHFDRQYQMTYFPGGQLRTITRLNSGMNYQSRTVFNYDAYGNTSSEIYLMPNMWDEWEPDYRRINTYTPEGYLSSYTYEYYNGGSWDFDYGYKLDYFYANGRVEKIETQYTNDGENYMQELVINYAYTSSNTPSIIEFLFWDENILSFIGYQKRFISEWGPHEFRPDFLFYNINVDAGVTDYIVDKYNWANFEVPHAESIIEMDYDYTLGVYTDKIKIESTYNSNNQRTELVIFNFDGVDYAPDFKLESIYHNCYGFRGSLEFDYVDPIGWQLSWGRVLTGETTPYNESCFVTAYDVYTDFSAMNGSGTRTRRYEIQQPTNLSIEDNTMDNGIQAYPNPTLDFLNVRFENFSGQQQELSLVGLDGRVYFETVANTELSILDLNAIPAGMYVLVITNEKEVTTQKVIKK